MAKFKKRTTAPSKTDKHYYSKENIFYKIGYGMPNCTAYAWGRLYEITGKMYDKLCGNAEEWWAAADKAGLKKGNTPKLGAIICWRAGVAGNRNDGAGHVAVVEEIKANGDIVTSNSAYTRNKDEYAAKTFYTKTITKASGYQYSSDRQLQGFIYCGIDFEDETPSASTIKAGDKLNLLNEPSYSSESSSTIICYRTGVFYAWDNEVRNGRRRITNHPSRVGVAGQVTCWIDEPKPAYRTYTVKKGDTLWNIAARELGKGSRFTEIIKLNGLRSTIIYAGKQLKLPNK